MIHGKQIRVYPFPTDLNRSMSRVVESLAHQRVQQHQSEFRLANAIELQKLNFTQAPVPDVWLDPSPNLTVIQNIVLPQLARHDEAIQILGAKDVCHFSPDDVALLCELFQVENQVATYISMSKCLPDEVHCSWLTCKIWGPPDPIQAMTSQLGVANKYGSPYSGDTGTPSAGSASFDSDTFDFMVTSTSAVDT